MICESNLQGGGMRTRHQTQWQRYGSRRRRSTSRVQDCRSCCCPTADRIPLSPYCVRDSTISFSVPRPINVYLCGSFLHQSLIRHEAVTMHSSTAKSLEIYSELTPLRSSSRHLPQIGCGAGTWRKPSRARVRARATWL